MHYEILRLASLGMKPGDIAAQQGVTKREVNGVIGSELGRAELARLNDLADVECVDVMQEIKAIAPAAVELHKRIIDGTEDASVALRAKVAGEILDRAGYGRTSKIDVNKHYFGEVSLNVIKERAVALGLTRGNVIDVEASPC